ncbi:MAG: hypothetical protein ACOX4O_07195 [Eubacteriales bacterium]|jgi:hypothetical protein
MKKLLISLLLACLLLISACADAGGTADETAITTAAQETAEQTAGETTAAMEIFRDSDLEGFALRIGDTKQYDIYLYTLRAEENGEVINDAIYCANRLVEETLNIKIEPKLYDDPGPLERMVLSGDDECDIVTCQDLALGNMALKGYFYDISEFPNNDFSAPWWPESAVKAYRINNRMVVFSNYMSYFGVSRIRAWFINKQLCADFGMEVPYQKIYDGVWTLDALGEMMSAAYSDVNGNGVTDAGDKVSYVNLPQYLSFINPTLGLYTFTPDANGALEYTPDVGKTQKAVEKLYSMLYDSPAVFSTADENPIEIFKNGDSLFIYDSLNLAAGHFRDSEVEYGILCPPKLDETQPDYVAVYTDYMHAVPLTAPETDKISLCIEAMTVAGYTEVYPAFVEISLKNKYSYDEDSAKVIDLLRSKMFLDVAYTFGAKMSTSVRTLLDIKDPNTNVSSYYEKHSSADIALMEKLNSFGG